MADIDKLKQLGTVRKFNIDDYICREGEQGNEMYIIVSGKVAVYINSVEGYPIKVSEISQGSFFGEMCLFEDLPRSASVVAVEETCTLTINKLNLEIFIQSQPSLTYKIMKGLSSRIRSLNNEIRTLKKGNSDFIKNNCNPPSISPTVNSIIKEEDRASNKLRDILFPLNHKEYKLLAPEAYNEYLFDKDVLCPVCGKNFSVKMQRLSKLKLNKVNYDFRKIYNDFEPLWYSLWICPNCYYTNSYNDFNAVPYKAIKQLKEKLPDLKELYSPQFKETRSIDQVFTEYYMAMYCAKQYNANSLKFAKIWLQLSWLYSDVKDADMHKEASGIALTNYYNSIYKDQINISQEQEQQLYLILGELFYIKGDNEEARKHFYAAIKRKGGSPTLNQQAMDRIQEVKTKL
jgi:uncharacterized protein